jgi:predicted nucleic acid-binding protein
MITAVDTNILLDILIPDETFLKSSKELLDQHISKGQLIICELVYAELSSQFLEEQELRSFIADTGIRLVPSDQRVLSLAGRTWKEYRRNRKAQIQCPSCGKSIHIACPVCKYPLKIRQHIISDFMIGAHALHNAEILLSRDRGFYKTYFKGLRIEQLPVK